MIEFANIGKRSGVSTRVLALVKNINYIRIFNMSVNINEITEANSKEKLIFTITILDKAEKINAKK